MKTLSMLLLACMVTINQAGQGIYVCKNASISLFSSAPIEDIKATTTSGLSVYNAATNDLAFSVNVRSLHFEKSLMQEHFNDNYMESEKYPKAVFKGKVQEHIDVSKDGSYPVTATGELTMHGITQKRTIPGTLTVKQGNINMKSEFMVKCVDHHIQIPRIVLHNIAESIQINVDANYMLNK